MREKIRALLISWEIYPIVLIAAFLRLFHINASVFSQDESDVYQLARDAVVYHWLPLTSNHASIGNLNPPLVVYIFILPALFSSNPIWGQAFVALLNTGAVLLTYFFTRRYYGRLAGTIAAALFATSVSAWMYSRFIWSPNVEPVLVIPFLWLLFRGVVEQRKGWFFPALVLLGALYQLHGSTLSLGIPLAAAVILARRTIRWREIGYAFLGLLLIFSPFIYWECQNGFLDLKIALFTAQQQAEYNVVALRNYLFFIHPTIINPYSTAASKVRDNHLIFPNTQSILNTTPLHFIHPLLQAGYWLALLFLVGGLALAAALVLFPRLSARVATGAPASNYHVRRWWTDFQATPMRKGLLLLLLWQIVPLMLFIRHSITLFDHYFIFFLPGQFILMAVVIAYSIEWVRKQRPSWERWTRYSVSFLAVLLVLAQLIGTTATAIDLTSGHFDYRSVYPNYTDLQSQQNALRAADQLAEQRGIHRIYFPAIYYPYRAIAYLAEQIKTPVEVDYLTPEHTNCLLLPDLSAGPVIMLVEPTGPASTILALVKHYTNAMLVGEAPYLGGKPYKLYILTAKAPAVPMTQNFTQGLQLLSPSGSFLPGTRILTTNWRVADTQQPGQFTNYHYSFHLQEGAQATSVDCQSTETWAGDQLIVFQDLSGQAPTPTFIDVQASAYTEQPTMLQVGPLTLTSVKSLDTNVRQLSTTTQGDTLTIPLTAHP